MLYSVILAGGSGTRLWLLSTKNKPKQFLKLFSEKSMILETSYRIRSLVPFDRQYVLTGENLHTLVEEQFDQEINILVEPAARNTAPCLLWAALKIRKDYGSDSIIAALPSDHNIKDKEAFLATLSLAVNCAEEGKIVTFGMLPNRPETGYGYIEIGDTEYKPNLTEKKVVAFREKPDKFTAVSYLDSGKYLWNSGMFVFNVQTLIEEFERYCPEIYSLFFNIDLNDRKALEVAFLKAPSISIDYPIMEHTQKASCIPSSFGWSDIGGYESLYEESEKDVSGNVCNGDVIAQDTNNCYIHGKKRIVTVGLDDMVVVETENTILVARKNMSAKIGELAKMLD